MNSTDGPALTVFAVSHCVHYEGCHTLALFLSQAGAVNYIQDYGTPGWFVKSELVENYWVCSDSEDTSMSIEPMEVRP